MKVISLGALLLTLNLQSGVQSYISSEDESIINIETPSSPHLKSKLQKFKSNWKSKRLVVFDKSDDKTLTSVEKAPHLDDKRGLIEENVFDAPNHNPNYPRVCSEGIPCQTVDSKVNPPISSASKLRWLWFKHAYAETNDKSDFRSRRNAEEGTYWEGSDCQHEAKVRAFGGKYILCLFLQAFNDDPIIKATDLDVSQINVTIFGNGNQTMDIPLKSFDLKYATGFVKGEPFTSVSGFIMDNHFYGTVIMKDTVHYLEPHRRKSRDMHILGDGRKTLLHRHNHNHPNINQTQEEHPYASDSTTPLLHQVCDLTIVADHLFFKEIGEMSINKTLLQMLWHVKEANNLIRSKDFTIVNGSVRRHCLSFTVSEISIFIDPDSDVNLLKGEYKVPESFLKQFSRYNFDGFCLGVLFTNRIFNELVLGLSWRGNPRSKGVGGICQRRVRMKSDKNAYSFNALFISLKSAQENRIPLRMGVLNLVHELLHSFGARHDPDTAENPLCTPRDKWINGRYLMSKYSNDGHKLNHEILSPCTESAVMENLKSHHRTKCLRLHSSSICGDGIVQDEECDCGTTFQCVAAKSCCIPHEGFKNSNACTFHKVDLHNCTRNNTSETNYLQIKNTH